MLILLLVFERRQAEDCQPLPYPLRFRALREAFGALFPIYLHRLVD